MWEHYKLPLINIFRMIKWNTLRACKIYIYLYRVMHDQLLIQLYHWLCKLAFNHFGVMRNMPIIVLKCLFGPCFIALGNYKHIYMLISLKGNLWYEYQCSVNVIHFTDFLPEETIFFEQNVLIISEIFVLLSSVKTLHCSIFCTLIYFQ